MSVSDRSARRPALKNLGRDGFLWVRLWVRLVAGNVVNGAPRPSVCRRSIHWSSTCFQSPSLASLYLCHTIWLRALAWASQFRRPNPPSFFGSACARAPIHLLLRRVVPSASGSKSCSFPQIIAWTSLSIACAMSVGICNVCAQYLNLEYIIVLASIALPYIVLVWRSHQLAIIDLHL